MYTYVFVCMHTNNSKADSEVRYDLYCMYVCIEHVCMYASNFGWLTGENMFSNMHTHIHTYIHTEVSQLSSDKAECVIFMLLGGDPPKEGVSPTKFGEPYLCMYVCMYVCMCGLYDFHVFRRRSSERRGGVSPTKFGKPYACMYVCV